MSQVYGVNTVVDGLVLCLDAGNHRSYPGSGTTWTDVSGNGNTGTLFNSPTFSTDNSRYLSFDGTNDYATIPSTTLPSGNELTLSVWNYGYLPTVASALIRFVNGSGVRLLNVHLTWSDGNIYFDAGDGSGGSYDRISKGTLIGGEWVYLGWHHWVFTKNASAGTMKIYRDGELWQSGSGLTRPIGTATGTGYIATTSPTGTFHAGYISNISLFNRELSVTEVVQNYNATKTRFGL